MVYVNEEQLEQVKYLLEQSALGNHLLFDNSTIRRIANTDHENQDRVERAEKLLEEMILCPTLAAKRAFLENLDRRTYDDVVRIFLNVVQNTLKDSQEFPQ
ncbi:MAG: hypothetical protein HUU37_05910 [Bdellovibrionales bacterium]|nr:hypothetical protein [Bdellovibrionales bacterium]